MEINGRLSENRASFIIFRMLWLPTIYELFLQGTSYVTDKKLFNVVLVL